jgi:hypothetical protein
LDLDALCNYIENKAVANDASQNLKRKKKNLEPKSKTSNEIKCKGTYFYFSYY